MGYQLMTVWASRIRSLANFLRRQGIGRGDRISILDVNSLAFFEAYYAAAGLGAILNPINYRLSVRELTFILNDAGSRWLLASPHLSGQVNEINNEKTPLEGILWLDRKSEIDTGIEQAEYGDALGEADTFSPVDIGFEAPAHLYYTSGTTGKPKGVVLTHHNVCRHAEAAVEELEINAADVWGHIAPMFHLADAWAVFAFTLAGSRHLILPTFDAAAALELIEAEKMTISNLIPTMLNLMVNRPDIHEYDLSSLRVILSSGAPIAPEVVLKIVEKFRCDYVQTYGMTETSPYLALSVLNRHLKQLPADQQLAYKARTGRPFKTIDMRVMRDDGQHEVEANDEEVGEIWVRGETVMPGYWNLPEETLEAFTDGWFRTGDLAVIDQEGYVNIVDRKKDMIISGGENIYSIEVESVLYEHPKVMEAAVIGVPDDIWGEMVHAYVVLKPGAHADEVELLEFCREMLTTFKVPQSIEFLSALPKTGSGKIFKKALKEQYEKR
jgi:acyl-CoA synthetase (AMP-forming)/AMP-acid ligase II